MKKFALLLSMVVLLAMANSAHAQGYKSAVGLRLGFPLAVSYKFFISDPAAIELYLGYRGNTGYNYINPGAMYLYHFPISSVDGLQWYVGGGAQAFLYSYDFCPDCESFAFGINGAIGLDYKFANAPINLSVDWLPTIVIGGGYSGFGGDNGALSARYTLN
ncbi:MAG: hypothetical protein IPP15_03805 [Saprospiraceae bacterium]|uniref:Outer membrane protein beta-barrel domain-containing protein n=1 Tax=Candidatus Opimibacter skivensis TaxID=2982028 RepID=A0A9D7SSP6_9BACT|nr:hypothetical protein [Candidatus Opimibacter skivensis]